jgi:hypothetical protein
MASTLLLVANQPFFHEIQDILICVVKIRYRLKHIAGASHHHLFEIIFFLYRLGTVPREKDLLGATQPEVTVQ